MSPREVQGLQALAEHHGGTLTINPDTGLPEAGVLDKLLPTIIGAGLTFFGGVPPNVAAMIVGGIQTARTGSLMEGVKAGVGAYGGAGLAQGLATAGAGAIGSEAAKAGAGLTGDMAFNLADAGVTDAGIQNLGNVEATNQALQQQATERVAAASPFDKLSAGAKSVAENPMGYATKDNFKYMAAAAAPILADQAVKSNLPTTATQPGQIRPYSYDPYSGSYTAGNPYEVTAKKAADGGLMGMDNGGYSPGQLDFTQQSEPVVRMASGGIAGYADGGFTQDQINAALKSELAARGNTSQADLTAYAKSQYGLNDAQINAAYDTIPGFNAQGKYDAQDYIATSKPGQVSPQMVVDAANAANPYSAQNMAKVDVTRPGQYVYDASGNPVTLSANSPGFNANNPTALTYLGELAAKGGQDSTSLAFNKVATPEQKAEASRLWTAEKARLDALDAAKGLAGLNQNQNLLTNQNQNLLADTSKPPANETPAARDARLFQQAGGNWNKAAELRTKEDQALVADPNYWTDKKGLAALPAGSSDVDKWFAARGLGLSPIDTSINNFLTKYKPQLAAMTPKQQEDAMRAALNTEKMNEADVIRATGMTIAQLAAAKRADGSLVVAGNLEDVPIGSLPGGVSGGGNTQVNANGTITTRPDIPGIPEGGFTGMKDVRDTYTKGGGSLGYTSPTYTPAEFKTKYEDKLTGGSADAYNYLTGKTKYSPIPSTPTGEVMKPYAESVLGIPTPLANKKYIFDPTTKTFKVNPDYAIPTYDSKGVKSSNLTNADVKTFMNKKPSASDFYTWATTNNLSPEQIAAASERPINEISKLFTGAKALTGDDGKIDQTKVDEKTAADEKANFDATAYLKANKDVQAELDKGIADFGTKADPEAAAWEHYQRYGKAGGRAYTKKAAEGGLAALTMAHGGATRMPFFSKSTGKFTSRAPQVYADGGISGQYDLGSYSDGGQLLRGPGDGVSDSIPATIGNKQPARLADGEFVVPARIVSELGNGSTEAGARKLYAMMDRVQAARKGSIGKGKVAKNSRADKYLPA